MLHFFVQSDSGSHDQWKSAESRATAAMLAAAYSRGGPRSARFPGLLWPFTLYLLGTTDDIHRHTDEVVANCRTYGGEWEVAVALMLRTHIAVDTPGGLERADADWAELRRLGERLGDRWIRAQVHGASAEIEVARGQYAAALADFEAAHRLGRELGAYGEGAFLLARMSELAHRRGDDDEARKLVEQAAEEAELYSVWDAHTYIRYLKGLLCLRRGELREARELCESAVRHMGAGTPPPTFQVVLTNLGARITAAEGDPAAALLGLAEAAGLALAEGCTEPVVGAQLDSAAEVLVELGDLRSAARMSAASAAIRGPLPRTVPELVAADAVDEWARAGLGEEDWAAACAEGAVLDRSEAVAALLETARWRPCWRRRTPCGDGSSPRPLFSKAVRGKPGRRTYAVSRYTARTP
jgi:tetratricopeptide (TPR) repeat protein